MNDQSFEFIAGVAFAGFVAGVAFAWVALAIRDVRHGRKVRREWRARLAGTVDFKVYDLPRIMRDHRGPRPFDHRMDAIGYAIKGHRLTLPSRPLPWD